MSEPNKNMNLICLDYAGIKQLAKEVADKLVKEAYGSEDNLWIDEKEAMHLLRINSKTTFQKYRDEGKFSFSRLSTKLILYNKRSILDFIESNSTSTT